MAVLQEDKTLVDGEVTATPIVLKNNSERTGKASKGHLGKTVESPPAKSMKTRRALKQGQKSSPPTTPPRKGKVMKK